MVGGADVELVSKIVIVVLDLHIKKIFCKPLMLFFSIPFNLTAINVLLNATNL